MHAERAFPLSVHVPGACPHLASPGLSPPSASHTQPSRQTTPLYSRCLMRSRVPSSLLPRSWAGEEARGKGPWAGGACRVLLSLLVWRRLAWLLPRLPSKGGSPMLGPCIGTQRPANALCYAASANAMPPPGPHAHDCDRAPLPPRMRHTTPGGRRVALAPPPNPAAPHRPAGTHRFREHLPAFRKDPPELAPQLPHGR